MARLVSALVLVALCLGAAQAQHIAAELAKGGYTSAIALAKCSGVDKALANSAAKVTVLAPTNAAIATFAKDMGMSVADILKNEILCDTLVQYHIIPAVAKSSDIKKTFLVAPTLSVRSKLTFTKMGGKVMVIDAQGNKATVTKGDVVAGGSIIHGVDRVLLSRSVFTSPAKALSFYSKRFTALNRALTRAGLLSTVSSPAFAGTVLAPTDKAFAKIPGALTLAMDRLKNVLLYHVLPTARTIPLDFESGKSYETMLKGQTVKYMLTTKAGTGNMKGNLVGTATFTDAAGKSATVLGHNIFAGKAVFHVINAVLMPASPRTQEKGPVAAPVKKAVVAVKMAAGGRHLLQERADTQDLAIQNQMDAASIAINNAAMGTNPSQVKGIAGANAVGLGALSVPDVGEDGW